MSKKTKAKERKAAQWAKSAQSSGGNGPAAPADAWAVPPKGFQLFTELPVELVLKVSLQLPGTALVRLGSANRELRTICSDPHVWVALFQRERIAPWLRISDAREPMPEEATQLASKSRSISFMGTLRTLFLGPESLAPSAESFQPEEDATWLRVSDASLPQELARLAPDFARLRQASYVDALKIVYFAPRSLGPPRRRVEPQRNLSVKAICRQIGIIGDDEIAETGRILAEKVFSLGQDDRGPDCHGCPPGVSPQKPIPGFEGAQSFYSVCRYSLPDLWFCLAPGCGSIRCGRACEAHGLGHWRHEGAGHDTAIKLSTLEFWCYTCDRWLGSSDSHPLEMLRIREIGRKIFESEFAAGFGPGTKLDALRIELGRNVRRDRERGWAWALMKPGSEIHLLVGEPFIAEWQDFYMGEGPPPTNLENTSLYLGNSGRLDSQCHRFPVYGISSQDSPRFAETYLTGPNRLRFPQFFVKDILKGPEYDGLCQFLRIPRDVNRQGQNLVGAFEGMDI